MTVTNRNLQVSTTKCVLLLRTNFIAQDRDHGASVDLSVDLTTQSRQRQLRRFGGAQAPFQRRLRAS